MEVISGHKVKETDTSTYYIFSFYNFCRKPVCKHTFKLKLVCFSGPPFFIPDEQIHSLFGECS